MTYNLTAVDNVTSLTGFFVNINTQTNGYPWLAAIIIIFFATFVYLASRNLDTVDSLIGASFLGFVVSALSFFAGFTNLLMVTVFIIILFVGIIVRQFGG